MHLSIFIRDDFMSKYDCELLRLIVEKTCDLNLKKCHQQNINVTVQSADKHKCHSVVIKSLKDITKIYRMAKRKFFSQAE